MLERSRNPVRRASALQNRHPSALLAVLAVGAVGLTAYGVVSGWRGRSIRPADSAPGRTSSARRRFGRFAVEGRTVTINRPREDLYLFWRDFGNLPRFMENIEAVEILADGVSRWTVAAPAGRTVTLVTEIVQDRPRELIAWRSTGESDIGTEGRVSFKDAPGGRGTEVEALIAYKPPLGELGRIAAKLFQKEPAVQARRELKRFKMLMETGEVADSHATNPPS